MAARPRLPRPRRAQRVARVRVAQGGEGPGHWAQSVALEVAAREARNTTGVSDDPAAFLSGRPVSPSVTWGGPDRGRLRPEGARASAIGRDRRSPGYPRAVRPRRPAVARRAARSAASARRAPGVEPSATPYPASDCTVVVPESGAGRARPAQAPRSEAQGQSRLKPAADRPAKARVNTRIPYWYGSDCSVVASGTRRRRRPRQALGSGMKSAGAGCAQAGRVPGVHPEPVVHGIREGGGVSPGGSAACPGRLGARAADTDSGWWLWPRRPPTPAGLSRLRRSARGSPRTGPAADMPPMPPRGSRGPC